MKEYTWNVEKNNWLIEERGLSFERIVYLIEHGGLLDIVAHHNPSRYPDQKILVVNVDEYACLVPFVESNEGYFLKTIIPSRKATKTYLEALNE
ncbi:MAG TPA: hypothetical protein VFJ08_00360 [Salinisphaera sp.]|nr:hypothetical protein [Salinisphaera sp.]